MKKIFLINTIIIFIALSTTLNALQSDYFDKGRKLYETKKFDESKIYFERDLVFNPKSEKSYLYLAKIFNKKEDQELEEINLNNVLLLNPQNDEAIYMLTLLKIKQSDYEKTKELIEKFTLVCKSFCSKKKEIEEKMSKITPENAKN